MPATCPACRQPLPPSSLTPAAVVLAAAEAEWRRDVREPPHQGAPIIDAYIRGTQGLTWGSVETGPGARPGIAYTRNRQFEWCGAFAAYCYGAAGLKRVHRLKRLASTYRLWVWAGEDNGARHVDPEAIQAGDIVVMGPAGDRDGAHIAICAGVVGDRLSTYEGNAHGDGPTGERIEGVVRQVRPLAGAAGLAPGDYRVIFGVRPLPADFVGVG